MGGTWLGEYFLNTYKDDFITCGNCKWRTYEGRWEGMKCPECGQVDKEKILELINSLNIIDYEADGEFLYYAIIEGNENNKEILIKAGITEQEIKNSVDDEGNIDLTHFVFNYSEWFDGQKFLLKKP